MATRKRNEWLEADESEEELDYASELEESRGKAFSGRAAKRRRVERDEDEESDVEDASKDEVEDEDDEQGSSAVKARTKASRPADVADEKADLNEEDEAPLEPDHQPSLKSSKRVSQIKKQAEKAKKKAHKTGVVYLSRIPPFMKPQTLRHLLQPFGEIGRIFLTPEDTVSRQQRVRQGGNKKRTFTDGWVEFLSKRSAKLAAETLNTQTIGGKKGGYYHDDVWNIKYLKGYKWHDLTEAIANENAERAARMRAEIAQTTRENKIFVDNVERAKMLETMEAKRRKKEEAADGDAASSKKSGGKAAEDGQAKNHKMVFKQNEVKSKAARTRSADEQPEEVKRVLSKIF